MKTEVALILVVGIIYLNVLVVKSATSTELYCTDYDSTKIPEGKFYTADRNYPCSICNCHNGGKSYCQVLNCQAKIPYGVNKYSLIKCCSYGENDAKAIIEGLKEEWKKKVMIVISFFTVLALVLLIIGITFALRKYRRPENKSSAFHGRNNKKSHAKKRPKIYYYVQ